MQTADFDHNDFQNNHQNEADKKLMVKFYDLAVKDSTASLEAGRVIFKDTEMVDIRVPGSKDSVARPATPRDKARFPQHYAAFKQRMEAPVSGTPLVEWSVISRSMADQLSFKNIKTVEQLADLNDSLMQDIPGIVNLKQKATDWLKFSEDNGMLVTMREELDSRDKTIDALQYEVRELISKVEELASKSSKKSKES